MSKKLIMNIVGYLLMMLLCIAIFNMEATKAGGRAISDDTLLSYNDGTDRSISFGEYFAQQEKNNPGFIEYCKGKAHTAMGVFNERESKTFGAMIEEIKPIKKRYGQVEYVDWVRMTRDITRKDKRTDGWLIPFSEETVLDYAIGELHNCVLQEF